MSIVFLSKVYSIALTAFSSGSPNICIVINELMPLGTVCLTYFPMPISFYCILLIRKCIAKVQMFWIHT